MVPTFAVFAQENVDVRGMTNRFDVQIVDSAVTASSWKKTKPGFEIVPLIKKVASQGQGNLKRDLHEEALSSTKKLLARPFQ